MSLTGSNCCPRRHRCPPRTHYRQSRAGRGPSRKRRRGPSQLHGHVKIEGSGADLAHCTSGRGTGGIVSGFQGWSARQRCRRRSVTLRWTLKRVLLYQSRTVAGGVKYGPQSSDDVFVYGGEWMILSSRKYKRFRRTQGDRLHLDCHYKYGHNGHLLCVQPEAFPRPCHCRESVVGPLNVMTLNEIELKNHRN